MMRELNLAPQCLSPSADASAPFVGIGRKVA
jgi:hypothetical protein